MAVFTALPSYCTQGRPFLAFVYGIAAHKVADAHRSAARNRAEPVAEVPDAAETADGPEAQVLQVELAGLMASLLEMLPDRQREILRLRVVVGLSAEETAEVVGSTPGAVRVAQHRTLSRLRSMLATENDEPTACRHRVIKPAEVNPSEDDKTRNLISFLARRILSSDANTVIGQCRCGEVMIGTP